LAADTPIAEAGVIGGDPQIAGERGGEPGADTIALHHGDHGLA
jgi:hypothetical protein